MGTSSSTLSQRIAAASGGHGGGCTTCVRPSPTQAVAPSILATAAGTPALAASVLFGPALAAANDKRSVHGVPPLALALGEATQTAMSNAATVAAGFQSSGCKTLTHTPNTGAGTDTPKVGQNIYAVSLGASTYTVDTFGSLIVDAVEMWYDEINGTPGSSVPYFDAAGKPMTTTFDSTRGHFTQLVWKSSTEVAFGVALAQCGPMPWLLVVANFTPPGNVLGAYVANVLPPRQ